MVAVKSEVAPKIVRRQIANIFLEANVDFQDTFKNIIHILENMENSPLFVVEKYLKSEPIFYISRSLEQETDALITYYFVFVLVRDYRSNIMRIWQDGLAATSKKVHAYVGTDRAHPRKVWNTIDRLTKYLIDHEYNIDKPTHAYLKDYKLKLNNDMENLTGLMKIFLSKHWLFRMANREMYQQAQQYIDYYELTLKDLNSSSYQVLFWQDADSFFKEGRISKQDCAVHETISRHKEIFATLSFDVDAADRFKIKFALLLK